VDIYIYITYGIYNKYVTYIIRILPQESQTFGNLRVSTKQISILNTDTFVEPGESLSRAWITKFRMTAIIDNHREAHECNSLRNILMGVK
jgi:hypothetical protein